MNRDITGSSAQDGVNRLRLIVRPPNGAPLLGVAREYDRMPASGEVAADFALPRAVVVSGRAVERGTGRPMLATRNEGCHGPGPVMGGHVWYRPLAGNASVTGNEAEGYFRHGVQPARSVRGPRRGRRRLPGRGATGAGGAPAGGVAGDAVHVGRVACPGRRATAITADSPTRP